MAKEHSCKCASCTASAKQATVRERERIIALLESRRCSENEQTHNCLWLNDYQADDLIALIKGEN